MDNLESKKEFIIFMAVVFLKLCCFYYIMTEFSHKTWYIDSSDSIMIFLSSHHFLEVAFRVFALSIATCFYSLIALMPAGIISLIIEKYTKRELKPEHFFSIAIIISCLFLTYTSELNTHVELYLCYLVFLPFEEIMPKGFIKRNKGVFVIWGIAALMIAFLVMIFKYLDNDSPSEGYIENLKSIFGKSDTSRIGVNNRGDDVSLLYERLIAKGYQVSDIGTEDVFRDKLSGKNNRIQLYNYIISRGDFKIGSYTEYDERITKCYNQSQTYICVSKGSRTYHKTKDCKALSRCSKQIKTVSVEQAKRMGRRECKICY